MDGIRRGHSTFPFVHFTAMTALADTDRLVLDTNIVRGLIEGRRDFLNVPKLLRLKGAHPVSIADGAFGELLGWLRTAKPDVLRRVKPTLERLDPVLDGEFPIIVGGSQRWAMIGVIEWPVRSRADESIVHNASWRHLKSVKDRYSLTKKWIQFRDTRGRVVTLTPMPPDSNLKGSEDEWWSDVIELPAGQELTSATEERLVRLRREHVARALGIGPLTRGLDRIDLHSHLIARRQREASRKTFNRPKEPSSNDWFDADLLVYVVLPAVICTEDMRFIRAVRQLPHEDRFRVMNLSDLYRWLETGVPS
jgi:hypothetical protein